ncbi:hypothetical protein F2P56_004257 [Juglans regia]|uniref:RNase H type-1 domain-containing protein n=1 Tax=Juglans regia TaxID=51240 RepID=A0A833Y6K8_JUGRE|nr:hypothetical protein F2P56_004257 [Juglans regia]
MDNRMNELDPVEEYQNENSTGISLVKPIFDDDVTANTEAPNTVSNEGPTEVQTVFDVSKNQIKKVVSWNPPPIGYLKLNVDGATFYEQHTSRVGVILRDHNGDILVACSKVERDVVSSKFIQAIAMFRGLQLCIQWGVPKLTLETDCLLLVNALNNLTDYITDFDFLLQDIQRMMTFFQEVQVLHINRLGNTAAH